MPSSPNLLFIQADQLSANALSHVGCPYLATPNLDRLAARSTIFSEAVCAFPKCVPSRTAWTYGRMPHEVMLPGTELDYGAKPGDPKRGVHPDYCDEEMGHWFVRHGYEAVYAGKWHVGQWGPTESLEPVFDTGFRALCRIHDTETPKVCTDYFRTHDRARPFLMVASFDNPHNICEYAWEGALPWGNLPSPPPLHELPPFPANGHVHPEEPYAIRMLQRTVSDRFNFSPEDWRRYRWAYYRLVEKVDAEIGKLLAGLDEAGLTDSTAIVFTSDHGDMQGSHLLLQKDTFYEESIHVPYLLALPGQSESRQTDTVINNALDTYPTLCDIAGIPTPEHFHGVSLLGECRGETLEREYVASELKLRFGGGEARMIRSARFKYIAYDTGPGREQLFDCDADRQEMVNLASCNAHAATLHQHRQWLREWLVRSRDPFGKPHYCHVGKRDAIPGDEF